MANDPIVVVRLNCWHANSVIYQADGETDDGLCVYVRYRRPWFSVGVGREYDEAVGADTFITDAHPNEDPSKITRQTLEEWSEGRFRWPNRIEGFANDFLS